MAARQYPCDSDWRALRAPQSPRPTTTGSRSRGSMRRSFQQSRSQLASCLTRRLHGKSVTMVLMAAGDQLDPVF